MNLFGPTLAAACALAAWAPIAHAQPWMERIDRHPSAGASLEFVDVANNGVVLGQYRFVLGTTLIDTGFIWTRQASLQLIGSASRWNASCISPDGSVCFGSSIPNSSIISYVVGSGGTVSSTLAGTPRCANQTGTEAYGSFASAPRTPMLFNRTSPASSFQLPLPSLAGTQLKDVDATACSASGSLLFGNALFLRTSDNQNISRAVAWNRSQAPLSSVLVPLPFGASSCQLGAVSAGAEYGAGSAWSGASPHLPWLYVRAAQAWAPLPLVADDNSGDSTDISASGQTLVGNTRGPGNTADRGRVWCNAFAFSGRSIESLLLSRGLDLSHWAGLSIRHISPDGQYIIGDGLYDGTEASWAAYVGRTCCPGDVNDDGAIDLDDYFAFFNCWDTSAPCADIDASQGVDLQDFFAFFNSFDSGC